MARERYDVLGVWLEAVDPPRALAHVQAWIDGGHRRYACFATVHGIMESRSDPALRAAYNDGLTVPDGMPLVWMGRLLGQPQVRRVYGPDTTLLVCEAAARHGWSCYFYGGAEGVAASMSEALVRRFPGLRVAGASAPPFRALTREEWNAEIQRINAAGSDVVFLGLGSPKQELWMAAHRAALTAPVLLGVGAAFDFHTGRIRQAPRWMMRFGLEWMYRLIQEPRRLWRRYALKNPAFVLLALGQLVRRRAGGSAPVEPPPPPG